MNSIPTLLNNKFFSYVTIEGYTSLVTYKNQIRTCIICHKESHEKETCPLSPTNKIINIRPDLPYVSNSNVKYAEVIQAGRSEGTNKQITQEVEERQSATKKNQRSKINLKNRQSKRTYKNPGYN
ncbi:hypothetical protein WA026_020841 [Henosepilachna vigintioctopunctata]|uniref:Uncharacterized protein n=1 Tax=Henosepilachna vigintioctopunctata TaxID=420089 RepID=A0AAW1TYZ8_9CUCU